MDPLISLVNFVVKPGASKCTVVVLRNFFAFVFGIGLVSWQFTSANPPVPLRTLSTASRVVASLQDQQYPTHVSAQAVVLPDQWWHTRPFKSGPVWYRLVFDLPHTEEPLWGVFIQRACSTADVYLNGVLIHSGGSMAEPVARNCFIPQLASVPSSLLKLQGNQLDIKLQGYALQNVSFRERSGGLSEVLVGPYPKLEKKWKSQNTWGMTLLHVLTVVTSVIAVLVLWFGWINRRENQMIYLGLLILMWNLSTARISVPHLPWSNSTVEFLVPTIFALIAALAVQFLRCYGNLKMHPLVILVCLQCILLPVSLLLLGPDLLFMASSAWYVLMALEVMVVCGFYFVACWRRKEARMWVTNSIMLALAGWILVEQTGYFAWLHPMQLSMVHFLVPTAFAVFGIRQLQAFARALVSVEASRAVLESRVAQASLEMERSYAQMAELRVEQVTESERKRIAGDLHDDLGAKLLTIVHTSESERISSLAREALEEMRLSVKGLTGRPMKVADALADWRAETVLRLGQAGVEVDWRSPAEDLTQQFSARAFVQTTRILREAVSNVIKHSGASHCKVLCSLGDLDFVLVVQDNGKGISMELDGKLDRGHGMASMKHRAKQMQGQCLVESGPGYGTVIRLSLPL
jgi:two-component system, NarL family, sensor histidine kinase UhpB